MTTHKEALEAAYLAGFNASGEGYNGEYPFGDHKQDPTENSGWKKDRDDYIKEALAQPEQEPNLAEAYRTELDKLSQRNYELRMENAKLKQPKEPEQEPVATLDDLEQEIYENTRQFVSRDFMEWMLKRYYTTPPQRKPWVSLSDEDIERIAKKARSKDHAITLAIREFKEKNA